MTSPRMLAPILGPAISSVLALALASTATGTLAQVVNSAPEALAIERSVPDARDVPFAGTITLDIDASDVARGLYRVTETIPVPRGQTEMIVQLPEYLPGNHSPSGPINLVAGIRFLADGKPVNWMRDPLEVYAFRVPVPAGTKELTASFVHTSPLGSDQGRVTMTREMLNLQWEKMSLYPAGHYVRQIKVKPTVTFPDEWQVFTALDGMSRRGDKVTWDAVAYDTLVDSPIFAGKYAQSWDLGHAMKLDAVADEPGLLAIAPENLTTYSKLADEALALFGVRHFDHYDLLLALTDRMGGIGLEHHRSSENQYEPKALVDWQGMDWDRNVIAHELVHSWNGKYRRPADLWTPDYRQPMQNSLLWMYEGQTQFWGNVLAARSGIQSKDVVLGALANSAGFYSMQPGREWRSVEDTTNDPQINRRNPRPYGSYHRSEDYYSEGMLVWLEADQIIRQGTGGARGLDDFAKAFFGGQEGDYGEVTYDFDDIVATLNGILPYDWGAFLRARLYGVNAPAPLEGIAMAGYKLVWKEEPNPYQAGRMAERGNLDLSYSLGIDIDKEGQVASTTWGSSAFDAALVDGAKIVAVNGEDYSPDRIKSAITQAMTSGEPIKLIVDRQNHVEEIEVDYDGGLKYPWLEPATAGEQGLDRLLAPRTGPAAGTAPAG